MAKLQDVLAKNRLSEARNNIERKKAKKPKKFKERKTIVATDDVFLGPSYKVQIGKRREFSTPYPVL